MIKGKNTIRVGGNVVERYREPVNHHAVNQMTQYIFDYKKCKAHIPDNIKGNLVEATSGLAGRKNGTMAINRNGVSAAYGPSYRVELGGTPDEPGRF
jgi:hypothetical protein